MEEEIMVDHMKDLLENILKYKERRNEEEEQKFLELVDQIFGYVDQDAARVLMKTFLETPDYGTQESVIGALSSAESDIFIQALIEELPRLKKEAPRWIASLVCPEITHRFSLFKRICLNIDSDKRTEIKEILASKELTKICPDAVKIYMN